MGALQAATRNPAQFLDATDKYGSVPPGKIADLVLLDADPLKDIHNTTKISVFLSGKDFDRAALDGILKTAETAASTSDPSQGTANNGQQTISPNPEMQKLFTTQLGRWSQRLERADGTSGQGEAVWQPGPGGRSLVEHEYIRNATGDFVGLSVTWWDEAVKGYRALWCARDVIAGPLGRGPVRAS